MIYYIYEDACKNDKSQFIREQLGIIQDTISNALFRV